MDKPEITEFLSYLASRRKVSASTQAQALSALLFLYRGVLGRDLAWLDGIVRAKRPLRVPVVLTREEVSLILGHPSPGRQEDFIGYNARHRSKKPDAISSISWNVFLEYWPPFLLLLLTNARGEPITLHCVGPAPGPRRLRASMSVPFSD